MLENSHDLVDIVYLSPLSSDDQVPLSQLRPTQPKNSNLPHRPISYANLATHKSRANIYDLIYGASDDSDEEIQASCSNKGNILPHRGNVLFVKVYAGKNKKYTYASQALSNIENDGEIQVMFLRVVKSESKFRLDEKDVAYIDFNDIIKVLPEPKILNDKGQIYYEFEEPLDIFEK